MSAVYSQLLLDPRWQRRRLEILERAGFKCEHCSDDKTTIHVHHKKYRRGARPWEYTDDELIALCEPCHDKEHAPRLTATDYELEEQIMTAQTNLTAAINHAEQRMCWIALQALVKRRSPAVVQRMESERGLR